MGLFFKSKEEKEAERRQRQLEAEQITEKIINSPMTLQLQSFILEKFGNLNSDEVAKLRRLAANGGRAGYLMEVQSKGIIFNLVNRNGESLNKWAITFDALGYEDLSDIGVNVLRRILLETLKSIPHLMVLDTGFFMYEQNRTKQSW